MISPFSYRRHVETTIICPQCKSIMLIGRTWQNVSLWCKDCNHKMTVEEAIPLMDDAMEEFLERSFCDRI